MTIANKLGVQLSQSSSASGKRKSISSPDDESFIKTPLFGPSLGDSPEMSPPPAYNSLSGIPDLPLAAFSLPPPALAASKEGSEESSVDTSTPESKTVILYVGRISWEKNIRLLIEAFKLLPESARSQAKLVFVGDGPARGDLTRLCSKYGLDATFMGHQKGKRLAAMYASSSVFAFPSFTETFGQVVLEALASGLPVVGLHAEGTSDLVAHGRTGLLLDVMASDRPSTSEPTTPTKKSSHSLRLGSQSSSSSSSSKATTAATTGLATPIPSIVDFAASMYPNSAAFASCARSYSQHLETLIRDRSLRTAMGQRAQLMAAHRSWWDAMDAVVRGYETVLPI
jgi:hypothetical protein